jgi:hypothetical protein
LGSGVLKTDPSEMESVYSDPDYAEVRNMLHLRLDELQDYYGDSEELSHQFLNDFLEERGLTWYPAIEDIPPFKSN